jgi:DnaJ-class molecular chaperone
MKNYYQILSVSEKVTTEEIKIAYRKLVKEYHPDINLGVKDTTAKFREIQEAYEILMNVNKRRNHDKTLYKERESIKKATEAFFQKQREEKLKKQMIKEQQKKKDEISQYLRNAIQDDKLSFEEKLFAVGLGRLALYFNSKN